MFTHIPEDFVTHPVIRETRPQSQSGKRNASSCHKSPYRQSVLSLLLYSPDQRSQSMRCNLRTGRKKGRKLKLQQLIQLTCRWTMEQKRRWNGSYTQSVKETDAGPDVGDRRCTNISGFSFFLFLLWVFPCIMSHSFL